MAMFIQQIRIDEITTLPGRRELRQLDDLIESIQTLGLLEPILVTGEAPPYRIVAGKRRYNAAKHLGWSEIPAVVLKMDDLHAELAAIDENLVRQELTILERSEELSRKKEIYEALHGESKRGNGPGRGHREKKRNNFAGVLGRGCARGCPG